jgi:hypothetical protein
MYPPQRPERRKPSPEKRKKLEKEEKETREEKGIYENEKHQIFQTAKSMAMNIILLCYLIYSKEANFLNRYALFIIKNTYQLCHVLIKTKWLKKAAFYSSIVVIIYLGMIAYSMDTEERGGSKVPGDSPEFVDETRPILVTIVLGMLCIDICSIAF